MTSLLLRHAQSSSTASTHAEEGIELLLQGPHTHVDGHQAAHMWSSTQVTGTKLR